MPFPVCCLADIDLAPVLILLVCLGHDDLQHAILDLCLNVLGIHLLAWAT